MELHSVMSPHKSDDRAGAAVVVGAALMFADVEVSFPIGGQFSLHLTEIAHRRPRGYGLKKHIFGDRSENFKTFRKR